MSSFMPLPAGAAEAVVVTIMQARAEPAAERSHLVFIGSVSLLGLNDLAPLPRQRQV